jgi:Uncharacterized protein conserved in bacteria (DUF2242)
MPGLALTPPAPAFRSRRAPAALGAVWVASSLFALLTACAVTSSPASVKVYQNENFGSSQTFAQLFDSPVAATCESARRALLSQGYILNTVKPDFIAGSKSFQPEGEVHVQILFNVVCVPEGKDGQVATAYVSATQDRYTLKKSASSASVGLSAIGSVSIPMGATGDSLVKVASETIPAGEFYERFFTLMQRLLREQMVER